MSAAEARITYREACRLAQQHVALARPGGDQAAEPAAQRRQLQPRLYDHRDDGEGHQHVGSPDDPDIDDDKGLRKFSANEGAYFAVLDALKTAKATAEIGDTLAIKVTKDPETSTSQADYAAKWTKGPGVPGWYEAPMPAQRIEDEVPF